MSDPIEAIHSSQSQMLAKLMTLSAAVDPVWDDKSELPFLLRHQMSCSLEKELGALRRGAAEQVSELRRRHNGPLTSFQDLFASPASPLPLLRMAKELGKRSMVSADGDLPREVAAVLYYVSISVALSRCHERITELDDDSLRRGLKWLLTREWVNDDVREWAAQGLRAVTGDEPEQEWP